MYFIYIHFLIQTEENKIWKFLSIVSGVQQTFNNIRGNVSSEIYRKSKEVGNDSKTLFPGRFSHKSFAIFLLLLLCRRLLKYATISLAVLNTVYSEKYKYLWNTLMWWAWRNHWKEIWNEISNLLRTTLFHNAEQTLAVSTLTVFVTGDSDPESKILIINNNFSNLLNLINI